MKLLVYTPTITPRIEYILNFVLSDILGIEFDTTTCTNDFIGSECAKINYSPSAINNALNIVPHSIMYEKGINTNLFFKVERYNELPAFAKTSDIADIQFDIFAMAFFLVTRYEEYGCQPDNHGRFQSAQSIASKNGFLNIPLVDFWAIKLLKKIESRWPSISHRTRYFNHHTTFDLDSSFAIANKGLRSLGATAVSLLKLNFSDFKTRLLVHLRIKSDPFDILTELFHFLDSQNTVKWFVHVGKYSKFDKSPCTNNCNVKKTIQAIANKYNVGIHPSYKSFNSPNRILKEKKRLQQIINKPITHSRFHYIRFNLPYSYMHLINCGITADYSMGYTDTIGFRASTCTPFYFFNLEKNENTKLKVYPFECMDTILASCNANHRNQLIEQIKAAIDATVISNGSFISIWHIDYLSGYRMNGNLWKTLKSLSHYLKACNNDN